MKKAIVICLNLILFLPTFSQEELPGLRKNNYFYIGPVDLVFNTVELGYERKLKNHNSIVFLGGFKLSKRDNYFNRMGGNGEFQYRINLHYNKETISGLVKKYSTFAYFAPFFQYRYEDITDVTGSDINGDEYTHTIVNSGFAGLGFGFRLTALENRFCANFFAGGGMKYSDVSGLNRYTDFFEVGYTGIAPKFGIELGINF